MKIPSFLFEPICLVRYDRSDVVFIRDLEQIKYYISKGAHPVDLHVEEDKSGKRMLCFVFYKSETRPLYEKWMGGDYKT